MCEDYRAGLGIDRTHDDADRVAGHRVRCPVLAIWATEDDLPELCGDVVGVWRGWADDVRGYALDCVRRQAKGAPEELTDVLREFRHLLIQKSGRSRG
jgi:haloacetate dehalogenase